MIKNTKHPRPDFERTTWLSLNGEWNFQSDPQDEGLNYHWYKKDNKDFSQKILVPFAWETPASGINQEWLPIGWYKKEISIPSDWKNEDVILNFGAVHYHCDLWLNGDFIGEHTGGYLPFSFNITESLIGGKGTLIIRVNAPLDKRFIPHGKQRSIPADDYDDCAFTASSGIWQSVWLENRPATFIENFSFRPDETLTGFKTKICLKGPDLKNAKLIIRLNNNEQELEVNGRVTINTYIPLQNPNIWCPESPYLYNITLELKTNEVDKVLSYSGLRKIEVQGDRILLNKKQVFLRGALDQGYWPESGYTPPDDAALKKDVELALYAGFNLIRKHIKLEDPRWLFWADQLGLLVWAEPPCVGRFSSESIEVFDAQLSPMVERDDNHPCIILWGVYNEEWGLDWQVAEDKQKQDAVIRSYDLLSSLDNSRPIIDNSGWWHVKTDIVDWHYYDEDIQSWVKTCDSLANDPEAWFGHRLSDTRWYETKLWVPGYENGKMPVLNGEFGGGNPTNQGWLFRWQTQDIRKHKLFSGYIYTELYDVEHEIVGIYTADRQLKNLGCLPTMVNSETILCINIVPIQPGIDYLSQDGSIDFDFQIAHDSSLGITGIIQWSWDKDFSYHESIIVKINPKEITSPIKINTQLPQNQQRACLFIRLLDEKCEVLAHSFLDVKLA